MYYLLEERGEGNVTCDTCTDSIWFRPLPPSWYVVLETSSFISRIWFGLKQKYYY